MRVKAKFEGREALYRRLNRLLPNTEKELAEAQLEAAQDLARAIENIAPIGNTSDAGDYRASIIGDKLSNHPGATAIVGAGGTKDKNATGVFAHFIWRFIEFGTAKRMQKKTGRNTGVMPAQPHIFPTYRARRKAIRRKVAGAVNKAVRKAKR